MAKIVERAKETSKTAELPADELLNLSGESSNLEIQGDPGFKQYFATFFNNLGLPLQKVTAVASEQSVLDMECYNFIFAGEDNLFFLSGENKKFFRKIIASHYHGKVADVISQYFLRKTCSVFAVLDGKELDEGHCSFQGQSAAIGNYNYKNWALSFSFENSNFDLVIGASPSLQKLFLRLSSNEIDS